MDMNEYEEQLMQELLRNIKYLGDIKMHKNDKNSLRQKRLAAETAVSAIQDELKAIRSEKGGINNGKPRVV